jgi:hypothetical protein
MEVMPLAVAKSVAPPETLLVGEVYDDVAVDDFIDSDGDGAISVDDYLLIHFSEPAAIADETAWYIVNSVGQTDAPAKSSAAVVYVFGLEAQIPPACACDRFGDPAGDGAVGVLDVVQAVNVAFRNFPPLPDPNPACPYATTDVDCSGDTGVLDVVKFVNVGFRNMTEASQFCNPCAP